MFRKAPVLAAAFLVASSAALFADESDKPIAQQRGLQAYGTENTREAVVVKAKFDTVTDALMKGNPSKVVVANPVGKPVTFKSRTYLVMQLKGHDWTVITNLTDGAVDPDKLAKSIAAFLKTRAAMFTQSGHTSTSHYRLYDSAGSEVERVDFTTSPDEFQQEIQGKMADPEVKKMVDEMKSSGWLRFSSKVRKLEGDEKKNGNMFIDRALRAEGALLPDLSSIDMNAGAGTPIIGFPFEAKDLAGLAVVTGDAK
jgi:hypothetical protein